MASTPVEVKRTEPAPAPVPAPAPAPDSWRQLRGEMERLFDRFGFGVAPFRNWFDLEPTSPSRTAFAMPVLSTESRRNCRNDIPSRTRSSPERPIRSAWNRIASREIRRRCPAG